MDYTDLKILADHTIELELPDAEVEERRHPELRGGQLMQSIIEHLRPHRI